jgi:hypothetical protein
MTCLLVCSLPIHSLIHCMKVRLVALIPSHCSLWKSRLSAASIIHLKKLIVSQLDREFSLFYGMRTWFPEFIRTRHWVVSYIVNQLYSVCTLSPCLLKALFNVTFRLLVRLQRGLHPAGFTITESLFHILKDFIAFRLSHLFLLHFLSLEFWIDSVIAVHLTLQRSIQNCEYSPRHVCLPVRLTVHLSACKNSRTAQQIYMKCDVEEFQISVLAETSLQ